MAAVVSFPETGSRKAILTLENGEKVDLSVKKGTISNANSTVINNNANQLLTYRKVEEVFQLLRLIHWLFQEEGNIS